ncbi:DhNV_030 [Dikerogammarus haemobaphes nudivirus]|nr:DhNV_030 [Dikerogammarus haemobaphes nudivirus]
MSMPLSFLLTLKEFNNQESGKTIEDLRFLLDSFKSNIKQHETSDIQLRTAIYLYYLGKVNLDILSASPIQKPEIKPLTKEFEMIKRFEDNHDEALREYLMYLPRNKEEAINKCLDFNFQNLTNQNLRYTNLPYAETEYTWLEGQEKNYEYTRANGIVKNYTISVRSRLEQIAQTVNLPIVNFERIKYSLDATSVYGVIEAFNTFMANFLGLERMPILNFDNVPFLRMETKDGVVRPSIFKARMVRQKFKKTLQFPVFTTYKMCVELSNEFEDCMDRLDPSNDVEVYNLAAIYWSDDVRIGINHKGLQIEIEQPENKDPEEMAQVAEFLRQKFYRYHYTLAMPIKQDKIEEFEKIPEKNMYDDQRLAIAKAKINDMQM